jgi:hypothetical protein
MVTSTHSVVGLYRRRSDAEKAVQDLVTEGFSRDQISVVAPDSAAADAAGTPKIGPLSDVESETGTGAAIGGIAGFIGGLAALAIPGIGPVLAAGPLAAGIMGAGIGAAAGGITGALRGHGIPEEHASRYSAAVGRGSCLVVVHTEEFYVDHAADVLDRAGALDVDEPDQHVGQGFGAGKTVTPEAVEAAKLKPGEGVRDRQKASERRAAVYPGITGGGPTPAT